MKNWFFQLILIALVSGNFVLPTYSGENCTCRYKGKDINEGASICMKTPNGLQMAECGRVLNNTAWKFTGMPCPFALLNGSPVDRNIATRNSTTSG